MYHSILFTGDLLVDVEVSPRRPLEHLLIRAGTRLRSQVKPYVVETDSGPVEVADLFFEDGTTTRRVPFACFLFAE
jgi:hypothetical protein